MRSGPTARSAACPVRPHPLAAALPEIRDRSRTATRRDRQAQGTAAAILVFVFAPLDAFFQRERPGWFPLALVVACGLLFIGLGIMLEAKE
jgi:hypothetical protein